MVERFGSMCTTKEGPKITVSKEQTLELNVTLKGILTKTKTDLANLSKDGFRIQRRSPLISFGCFKVSSEN